MATILPLSSIELIAVRLWPQSLHYAILNCLQPGGGTSPYIRLYWLAYSLVVAPVPTLRLLLGWFPLQWLIYWFLVLHSDGPTANHCTSMIGSIAGFWIPWLGIAVLYTSSAIQALGGVPSHYIKLYYIACSFVVAPVPTWSSFELLAVWWWPQCLHTVILNCLQLDGDLTPYISSIELLAVLWWPQSLH